MTNTHITPFTYSQLQDIAYRVYQGNPTWGTQKYHESYALLLSLRELQSSHAGRAVQESLKLFDAMVAAAMDSHSGATFRKRSRLSMQDDCHPLKILEDACVQNMLEKGEIRADQIDSVRQVFRATVVQCQDAAAARSEHAHSVAKQLGKFLKRAGVDKNEVAGIREQLNADLADGHLSTEGSLELCHILQAKGVVMEETTGFRAAEHGLSLRSGKKQAHIKTEFNYRELH